MKKVLSLFALLLLAAAPSFAQHGKPVPSKATPGTQNTTPQLIWPGKAPAPTAQNPFGVASKRPQPIPALQPASLTDRSEISITLGENGLPIFFAGKTEASGTAAESKSMSERALEYCSSLRPQGLVQPNAEFLAKSTQTDEQGNAHVRLEQVYEGLSVWGSELICHTQNGAFTRMNGRYFPTPKLASLTPSISAEAAISTVKTAIGVEKLKINWSDEDLKLIDGQPLRLN